MIRAQPSLSLGESIPPQGGGVDADVDISLLIWNLMSNYIQLNMKLDIRFIEYVNEFFQLYNNNYRPIYHLEKIIYYIIQHTNGDSKSL